MSSAMQEFYLFLSNLDAFFSCMMVIGRTSIIMLNRNGESEHPYTIYIREVWVFFYLYNVRYGILINGSYYAENFSTIPNVFLYFIMK
jgi:hypothetical protein